MKNSKKRQHNSEEIPMYLSAQHAEQASQDLMQAYSDLNHSIHCYTNLPDDEKKLYIEVLKNWLQAVDN